MVGGDQISARISERGTAGFTNFNFIRQLTVSNDDDLLGYVGKKNIESSKRLKHHASYYYVYWQLE